MNIPSLSDSDSSDDDDDLTQMTQTASQCGTIDEIEKKFRFRTGDDIINLPGNWGEKVGQQNFLIFERNRQILIKLMISSKVLI